MEEYYSNQELMKKLNISSKTLLRWRKAKKIPYIKLSDKKILYNKQEIDKLLMENHYD